MKINVINQSGAKPPLEIVSPEIASEGIPSLADYLKMLPPGPIQNTAPVTRLLIDVWDDLKGSDEGGMRWDKLLGTRCEDLSWDPPLLSFKIARHGATVNGSSRAELQYWCVDPVAGNAFLWKRGKRQVYPMSKRLNVAPIADEVAKEIETHSKPDHLKWYSDGSVRVFVSQIIPETYAQTTVARRKRFRSALVHSLASKGWKEIKLHTYKKVSEP